MQLDHVGGLHVREVAVRLGVVPQLGGRHGREVGRVGLRDAHPVLLEKPLRAVQALGGQLVIPERPEEFRDEHVRLLGEIPRAHVARHHRHAIAPSLRLHQRLQRDDRVGVLLHREHPKSTPASLRRSQTRAHERTSPGTNHHQHRLRPRRRVRVGHPIPQTREHSLFVLNVLRRVLLEGFVRRALEVIHQGLKRRLEVVAIASLLELLIGDRLDLAEEIDDVFPLSSRRV